MAKNIMFTKLVVTKVTKQATKTLQITGTPNPEEGEGSDFPLPCYNVQNVHVQKIMRHAKKQNITHY